MHSFRRMASRSLVVSLLVLAAACSSMRTTPVHTIPTDRSMPGTARRPSQPSDADARENKKRVTAKQEPVTLIAADRTQCLVDQEDFRRIRVGDEIGCLWSPAGRP